MWTDVDVVKNVEEREEDQMQIGILELFIAKKWHDHQ